MLVRRSVQIDGWDQGHETAALGLRTARDCQLVRAVVACGREAYVFARVVVGRGRGGSGEGCGTDCSLVNRLRSSRECF